MATRYKLLHEGNIASNSTIAGKVPYTGATGAVTLGANTLSTTSGLISPKLYPAADSTTAIQLNKADGTTSVVTVDTTNSRVGLGITPTSRLHAIDGTVAEMKFNSGLSSLTPSLSVGNTGASGKFAGLIAGTAGAVFEYDSDGFFAIASNVKSNYTNGTLGGGTARMYISGAGNVGIGTGTSPAGKFTVTDTKSLTYPTVGTTIGSIHLSAPTVNDYSSAITFGGKGSDLGQAGIYVQSSDVYGTKMYFNTTNNYTTGSQSRMMIDHAGIVGIGTTDLDGTPAVGKLTVKGTSNNGTTNIFVGRDSDEANVITINTDGKIDNGTSGVIATGTIELGHASDTTLSRVSAGVVAIEGNNILTANNAVPIWTAITGTRATNTTITVSGDQTAIFKKGTIVTWKESSVDKVGMVSIPSTYSSPNTTITIIGNTCASIDSSSFKYTNSIGVFKKSFAIAGNIGATGTDVTNAWYADKPYHVIGAELAVGTAGTTNNSTIDINKGGTTMFTTKPTLATTVAFATTPFTADTATTLALGDKVTLDIDAVQTTNAIDLYSDLLLFESRYLTLS